MSQPEKYGEPTITLSIRVPKTKRKQIKKQFKAILKTYEKINKSAKG